MKYTKATFAILISSLLMLNGCTAVTSEDSNAETNTSTNSNTETSSSDTGVPTVSDNDTNAKNSQDDEVEITYPEAIGIDDLTVEVCQELEKPEDQASCEKNIESFKSNLN